MTDKKIKIALLALLLVASPLARATITLPLPWQQGLKVRYQSDSVQEKIRAGKHERAQTRETAVLEIVEANEKGYLQVWHSQAPRVEVSGDGEDMAAKREIARKMSERFADVPLQAELDAQGVYTGIRNWEQLGATLREVMLPFMTKQAQGRPELAAADAAKLRETILPVLHRMTTQSAVNTTLGKQAAIYNFFTAPSLAPGKPKTYEDTLPSPWSADILPTVGSFEMTEVDEKAGTVSIRWQQSIDPVKGAAVARKMLEAIAGAPLTQAVAAGLPEGLKLTDEATVVIDRKSGVPLSLVHRRDVAFGGATSVTTWTLKKLADEAKQ